MPGLKTREQAHKDKDCYCRCWHCSRVNRPPVKRHCERHKTGCHVSC